MTSWRLYSHDIPTTFFLYKRMIYGVTLLCKLFLQKFWNHRSVIRKSHIFSVYYLSKMWHECFLARESTCETIITLCRLSTHASGFFVKSNPTYLREKWPSRSEKTSVFTRLYQNTKFIQQKRKLNFWIFILSLTRWKITRVNEWWVF